MIVSSAPTVAAPPPPLRPGEGDIADAQAQVETGIGAVGALINTVAAADEQIRQHDDEVARTREEVNKALVDLQNARAAADTAASEVDTTGRSLADAGTSLRQARGEFDRFAAGVYTQPSADTVLSYLAPGGPTAALDRAQVLGLVTRDRQKVLDDLRRAQIELGNAHADARRAQDLAEAARVTAEQRRTDAEAAMRTATAELDRRTALRDDLLRQRADAQARLDAARSQATGLQHQQTAYLDWERQRRAEETLAAATAAARAAADHASQARAAEAGAGKPAHTLLEDQPRRTGKIGVQPYDTGGSAEEFDTPRVTGPAAVEIVVDRALSQLGVNYAWGGGSETGPTRGIRDGGAADNHGDYRKVGFDCSGLMVYAFAGIGVSLPHYSGYQYNAGARVPVAARERGDMLFWGPGGSSHVAVYLGDGIMVEAPESGDVVKVSPVREAGIMPFAVRIVG
ncbi:NlpC/P60 family protein [Nocardia brevicatena]|uniref:NlpC/P60 family protein n=1 Tax=Nocardia brevicatena TaxID=37327 RepID=UPI00247B03A0|nr:NlpC/P60 family protein [Nocardia brevicatena]